jgi:Tol biopolymer transport system component
MYLRTKITIAVVALFIISVAAIIFIFKPWKTESMPFAEGRGNTTGNIINQGLVTRDGDWIYYSAPVIEYISGTPISESFPFPQLRRVRRDGRGSSERLFAEPPLRPYAINVVGDWLYFRTNYDIRRMHKDGISSEILFRFEGSTNGLLLYIENDWLFFNYRMATDTGTENRIYRMPTDGGMHERISNINATSFNVSDGWIFYSNRDEDYAIYRIRTDGTEPTRLNDDEIRGSIIVDEGWIYYSNHYNGVLRSEPYGDIAIYKMRIDGTERQRITHDVTSGIFNVFDGWIYFSHDSRDGIYRMRTDGTDLQRIGEGVGFDINVIDEWVYFRPGPELNIIAPYYYRMRMDGTERERLH